MSSAEYYREYRELNREKMRKQNRESMRRTRAMLKKRGLKIGVSLYKQGIINDRNRKYLEGWRPPEPQKTNYEIRACVAAGCGRPISNRNYETQGNFCTRKHKEKINISKNRLQYLLNLAGALTSLEQHG